MVTVNERLNAERLDQRPGLLSELVEQDMADILTEYGARLGRPDARTGDLPALPKPGLQCAHGRRAVLLLHTRQVGQRAKGGPSACNYRVRLRNGLQGR